MNIISLNCWGGRRFPKLIEFIKQQASTTDVFCFQEMVFGGPDEYITSHKVKGRSFEKFKELLLDFESLHYLNNAESDFLKELTAAGSQGQGLAMFINKKFRIVESQEMNLYTTNPFAESGFGASTGTLLSAKISGEGSEWLVGTTHGLFLDMRDPSPEKRDTPERLEQSRRLVEFYGAHKGKKVLIGDFNLRPQTESIAMLSRVMKNLITEYGIKNTRNFEYEKMEEYKDYIADYAFTSSEVIVKDFKVLPDIVSDHAPLRLEIE